MSEHAISYEVQRAEDKSRIWIHSSDGSTVGRFSRMGIDIHNTVTDQMKGSPECLLCTHKPVDKEDWEIFKSKALEMWGVHLTDDDISPEILDNKNGTHW